MTEKNQSSCERKAALEVYSAALNKLETAFSHWNSFESKFSNQIDVLLICFTFGFLLALLGRSWPLLARSWPLFGRSWPLLGRSWPLLGCSWPLLGRCWNDTQKSTKNRCPKWSTWAPKSSPKVSQNGTKIGSQSKQKTMQKTKRKKNRKKTVLRPSWGDLGSFWVASWTQKCWLFNCLYSFLWKNNNTCFSKISLQDPSWTELGTAWVDFGSLWDNFLAPKTHKQRC